MVKNNLSTLTKVVYMRNKAIELMVRCQFNIPQETKVSVTCLACVNSFYDYEVEWWDGNDVRYQSNFTLPHIEYAEDTQFATS